MHIGEPTLITASAFIAIRTNVSKCTVKVPAVTTVHATPGPGTMPEGQLLTWAQTLAVIIIAIFASLAFANKMISIADFVLPNAVEKALLGCVVWFR